MVGCLQTGRGGWWWEGKREAEREEQVGFQGEMRKLLAVMGIFIILIVQWFHRYIQMSKLIKLFILNIWFIVCQLDPNELFKKTIENVLAFLLSHPMWCLFPSVKIRSFQAILTLHLYSMKKNSLKTSDF